MLQWTWESLSPQVVKSAEAVVDILNRRMKALQGVVASIMAGDVRVHARVQTTDATVTTIATEAMPVNTTTLVWGYVVARRTGGTAGSANDGAAYRVEFVAKNTAGTATVLAAATVTVIGESVAGWTVTATASSGNVLVQVTGAIDTNILWHWNRHTFYASVAPS